MMVSYAADGLERVHLSRGIVGQLPSVVGRAQRHVSVNYLSRVESATEGKKQTLIDCVIVCYQ